jgi:acetyltransferase-like isoleucine patch superfamily enzyme
MRRLLRWILRKIEFRTNRVRAWPPCNIYPTAKIGRNVSIGRFSEIGDCVVIGENTRIGAMSFIPRGVTIGNDVFIGPRFCGTNDKRPPSPRDKWETTIIEDEAAIGAGVTVICGVRIGRKALIGAGSVVTKSVPAGETWCGVPARKMKNKTTNGGLNG